MLKTTTKNIFFVKKIILLLKKHTNQKQVLIKAVIHFKKRNEQCLTLKKTQVNKTTKNSKS